MTARLGDVFYRTACTAAAAWVAFILVFTATLSLPDWTIATPVAAAGAVLIWSIGRALRYVLSRHWLASPPMTAVLAVLYASAIIFIGAFLFTAVEWLEPNRRFAIVLKCAILAAEER
jgi:hypothetical protein